MFHSCINSLVCIDLKKKGLFTTLNVTHTVDNQNVVFMKQHVEFCHPIYVLEVEAAITITRDLKQTLEAARWTPTGSKISRSRPN